MNQRKFLAKRAARRANSAKFLFTPGPASLTAENLFNLGPAFGRGDREYLDIEAAVLDWLSALSGQPNIARLQGSATFAIEIALQNFVTGRVLLMNSGYYSHRISTMLSKRRDINLTIFEQESKKSRIICYDVFSYNTGFRGVSMVAPTVAPGHQVSQSASWLWFSGSFKTVSLSI